MFSQSQHSRLTSEGGSAPTLDIEHAAEVLELTAKIAQTEREAEKAGEEGNVDTALKLMEEVEALKKSKVDVQARLVTASRGAAGSEESMSQVQKLRVCEVCGALLSIFDSDQ